MNVMTNKYVTPKQGWRQLSLADMEAELLFLKITEAPQRNTQNTKKHNFVKLLRNFKKFCSDVNFDRVITAK